ncbi:MAG: hypothetical protein AB7K73_03460 [Gammaproteobacteria bacterium]
MTFEKLLHGHDTVQCAYYLHVRDKRTQGIAFEQLVAEKEALRLSKTRDPKVIRLGDMEFLLSPYGTGSRYPLLLTNRDYRIEMGEFMVPSFYVTFSSEALWREGALALHQRFLAWAASLGVIPYREESLSRVDFTFDYHLPQIDFDEDSMVSLSNKDSQHRENGKIQTFTYGKGDIVLRVYDKVVEIEQQSDKQWFFTLWGRDSEVWRIEWQVRKDYLKRFGIVTFTDLYDQQGDLLRYLAGTHETLRQRTNDSNRSRWPLHPLWCDLQTRIGEFNQQGIHRVIEDTALLRERLLRIAISVYGYTKQTAAIRGLQKKVDPIRLEEALRCLSDLITQLHDPLTWRNDVDKRMNEIRLGYGK